MNILLNLISLLIMPSFAYIAAKTVNEAYKTKHGLVAFLIAKVFSFLTSFGSGVYLFGKDWGLIITLISVVIFVITILTQITLKYVRSKKRKTRLV